MKKIKTAALVGLGAIGGVVAPGLERALGHGNFRVIAGGERKIKLEQGVIINDKPYHFSIISPEQKMEPADFAIFAVKNTQLADAIEEMKHQIGPKTIVVSLLNGVESEEAICSRYFPENVLYSIIRIPAFHINGRISYPDGKGISFGEKDGTESENVIQVKELFDRAEIRSEVRSDMPYLMWYKFMANVGENQTAAILGIPYKGFQVSEHMNDIRQRAAREVIAVAKQAGINLTENDLQKQDAYLKTMIPNGKPSTLQDIEAGKKTEVDYFAGTVVRLGKKYGVETPCNEIFYHMIKTLEEKSEIMKGL